VRLNYLHSLLGAPAPLARLSASSLPLTASNSAKRNFIALFCTRSCIGFTKRNCNAKFTHLLWQKILLKLNALKHFETFVNKLNLYYDVTKRFCQLHRLYYCRRSWRCYDQQETCAIAKMTARCALYKWIEWAVAEIWPFEIIQDGGLPPTGFDVTGNSAIRSAGLKTLP